MGISSWLDVHYQTREGVSVVDIVAGFLAHGWNLNNHGEIWHLPLGAQDVSEWIRFPLDREQEVLDVLGEKESAQEPIGITLMWKDTMIGTTALFLSGKEDASFGLDINRKELPGLRRVTDLGWYLERILPPLYNLGVNIEYLKWSETS
jgi:hypothetical protein